MGRKVLKWRGQSPVYLSAHAFARPEIECCPYLPAPFSIKPSGECVQHSAQHGESWEQQRRLLASPWQGDRGRKEKRKEKWRARKEVKQKRKEVRRRKGDIFGEKVRGR